MTDHPQTREGPNDGPNNEPNEEPIDETLAGWLLDNLRAAFEAADPVPESLTSPDRSYVRWSSADAGLAELLGDPVGAGAVRAGEAVAANAWRFGIGEVVIELSKEDRDLAGSITPWSGGSAVFESESSARDLRVDDSGEFFLADVPGEAFRLRFRPDGAEAIVTEFVRVPLEGM